MERNKRTANNSSAGGPLLVALGTALLFVALLLSSGATRRALAQEQVTPVGTPVVETATVSPIPITSTVEITGTASPGITATETVVVTGTTTPVATGVVTGTATVESSPVVTGTVGEATATAVATVTAVATAVGTVEATVVTESTPTTEATVEATVEATIEATVAPIAEATPTSTGEVLPVTGAGDDNNLAFIALVIGLAMITIGLAFSIGPKRVAQK